MPSPLKPNPTDAPAGNPRRVGIFAALLYAEILLAAGVAYPSASNLVAFAFGDFGANLAAQSLIDDGLTPAVDFGAVYGLLPLLVGRVWLAIFGRTPAAFLAFSLAVDAMVAISMARLLVAIRPGGIRTSLLMALVPVTVIPFYGSFAHAIEVLLMVLALERLAMGSRGQALAACAVGLFVKQSMAVVLGTLILGLILIDEWRGGDRRGSPPARTLAPALGIGLAVAAILSAYFSPAAAVLSLRPAGARIYANYNFGFLREGRTFWAPPGVGPGYYLGTITASWSLATAFLAIGGLFALLQWVRRRGLEESSRTDVPIAVAAMHFAFILAFFGTAGHWRSYAYLIPIGLATAPAWKGSRIGLSLLILMVLLSYRSPISDARHWRSWTRNPQSAGLFAEPEVVAEWSRVLDATRGERALFLHRNSSATMIFPGFGRPVALYLDRGAETPGDLERTRKAIEASDVVVVTKLGGLTAAEYDVFRDWPQFLDLLPPAAPDWSGRFFRIYRRTRPG